MPRIQWKCQEHENAKKTSKMLRTQGKHYEHNVQISTLNHIL